MYFEDYNLRLTQKLGKKGRFAKVSEICAVVERSLYWFSIAFALCRVLSISADAFSLDSKT